MPDMLVNLLKLPPHEELLANLRKNGIIIRRARPYEITRVREFVESNFSSLWADEITVGYANKPVSVYIAIQDGEVVGFGAYECTQRAFFGPTGVLESSRGQGVGKALLMACLWGLREMGYVYGSIGGAPPTEFSTAVAGATVTQDSGPAAYAAPLQRID